MKNILYYVSIIFILASESFSQWQILNQGTREPNKGIDFVDNNVGWLLFPEYLLGTEDGGETWQTIYTNEEWDFTHFDFVNDSSGWAIAHDNNFNTYNILKSTDGGQSWIVKDTAICSGRSEVFAVNDSCIYVMNDSYQSVFKTVDNGKSWQNVSPPFQVSDVKSSAFLNVDLGVVFVRYRHNDDYKNTLLRTENGGESWQEGILDSDIYNIRDIQYINDSTAFFVMDLNTDSSNQDLICKTVDMFSTWITIYQMEEWISSLFALNKDTLFVLEDYRNEYVNKVIISTNGGNTWLTIASFENEIFNKIYFPGQDNGFLISARQGGVLEPPSGTEILHTRDGGCTWSIEYLSYPLNDIFFINNNLGFAVGGWSRMHGKAGCLFGTLDGGKTWQRKLNTLFEIKRLHFLNNKTGFALASYSGWENSIIYKTIDSGESWEEIPEESSNFLEGFSATELIFLNENNGFLTGQLVDSSWQHSACILETTNTGNDWKIVWQSIADSTSEFFALQSVYFVNENLAWAVGDKGLIVKYTAEDKWQEQSRVTDLPLKKVYFLDEHYGWICGGYWNWQDFQPIILKTSDGGITWTKNSNLPCVISDLFFEDSLHGWAVGTDTVYTGSIGFTIPLGQGIILETFDGGMNWQTIVSDLPAPLNAIYFHNNSAWAVGRNGLILYTDNLTTWIDQSTGDTYPKKYNLAQNFPNPFNPKTMISYQLPVSSEVELTIYNILGQKVATLVNKKQPAGKYKVEWDAVDFASGIYIYRLETNTGFIQSRKLVLLK